MCREIVNFIARLSLLTLLAGCLSVHALAQSPVNATEEQGRQNDPQRQTDPDSEQADSEAQTVSDTITVTARRREEALQDAPAAINVFTGADLKEAGIDRVEDFIALTPNVTLATSQGIGTSFLTIRGVTQVRNSELPVAVVIDGVQQFSPVQFRQELFDIESIQVVKGPQGALYGRNATGGAIIINTQRPENQTDGYFRAGYGDGDEYLAEGSVGGALIDDELYGQVSMRYIDRDGYITNITRQEKADPFEDLTLRSRVIWEPTQDVSLDLRAAYQQHDGRGLGFQFQGVDLAEDNITAIGFGTDTGPMDADNVLPPRDNNPDLGGRDMLDFSVQMNWESYAGTFTAVTSFTDIQEWTASDQFPYTAATSPPELFGADGTQTQYRDLSAWSQEFRFTSPSDQRLRWEAGVYYLDWERFISTSTGVDTGQGIIRLEREPTDNPLNPTNSFLADDNKNLAYAFFGQLNYDVTRDLELSAAARFDEEEREQFVSPLQFSAGEPGARNRETYNKFSPKLTARYMPTDSITLYGTWGEGFRSGQFNQNGVREAAQEAGLSGVRDVVDQEETESYEIGFKSSFPEYGLDINAAAFYTDVTNQQVFSFIGAISAQILTSIEDVEVRGTELELRYSPPGINGLDTYFAWGYTDGEIKKYSVDPGAVGNTAPYIAEHTVNTGIQYRRPIGYGNLGLFSRVDYELRGEQYWDPLNLSARDALNLVNLRLGIEDVDDRWSLIGEIENATDENYNGEWVAGGFSSAAPGRIWRVSFRYNYF